MLRHSFFLHISLLLLVTGCDDNSQGGRNATPSGESVPGNDPLAPPEVVNRIGGDLQSEPKSHVVFIHGLDGDYLTTWQRSSESNLFWPQWVSDDFPNAAVWSVNYDASSSKWLGNAMPIEDQAKSLLEELRVRGIGSKPTIFVAHSLGGLVVKQMLRDALTLDNDQWERIAANTTGVVFLATPHTGSGPAAFLKAAGLLFRPSAPVDQLQRNAPTLRDLNTWYRNTIPDNDIETLVFYENIPMRGAGLIVSESDSDPGINDVTPIRIQASHVTICKPAARSDLLYRSVKDFLTRRLSPVEPERGAIDALTVRRVHTLPIYYVSTDINIALLHPTELEALKKLRGLDRRDQEVVFYKNTIADETEYLKELVGPVHLVNPSGGQTIEAWCAASTPDFEVTERDDAISISSAMRWDLGVSEGAAKLVVKPAESELYSMHFVVRGGIDPFTYDESNYGEEEEEEEEDYMSTAYRLVLPDSLESVPRILREQESMDLRSVRKVSCHEHFWRGGGIQDFIAAMDATGVQKAIFVPTGRSPDNEGYKENMLDLLQIQKQSDRIVAFATVDTRDPDAPNVLRAALRDGARGLKLISGHPAYYGDRLNSEVFVRLLTECEESSIPVLIHVNLSGEYPEMADDFEELVRRFPRVTIILAHYGKLIGALNRLEHLLERYPNLYFDMSMGGNVASYLADIHVRQKEIRDFVIQHHGRALWGTDIIVSKGKSRQFFEERMRSDFYLLTREVYVSSFFSSKLPLHGLNLPPNVIDAIMWQNPHRILQGAVTQ